VLVAALLFLFLVFVFVFAAATRSSPIFLLL
jgi:hypothetical protein